MGTHLVSMVLLPSFVILATAFLLVGCLIWTCIYNVFFHPLRNFPGPVTSAASPFPLILQTLKGDGLHWVLQLHEKYGEVVRISPRELSFSGADAYKDIYGHKKAGLPTLEKDPTFYSPPENAYHIVNADFNSHARMRRIFSHAFSDRALKLQEPLFNTYVDRLILKIREGVAEDPKKQYNMVQMYNFTTFDIMGDLTFGEPLDMLADSSYHPWVAAMFAGFRYGVILQSIRYFPQVEALLKHCIPTSLREKMRLHKEFSIQRVNRRLEKHDARPDIWGLVLERDEMSGLTREEMYSNANIFMIAGTETTATLLSGLTYYLLKNEEKLQKLTKELRTAFWNDSEITIEKLQSLRYLNACIEEGLRMYPPVAQGLPRQTPAGAPTTIDGHSVPPETKVLVSNLAANRNQENWRNPYEFVPERHFPNPLESAPYSSDKKHGLQPFSIGPRACLGKNMAYHEMRLILTKLLYNFDISICEESAHWNQQKTFIMWDKRPLYCQLRPVVRI